MNSKLWTLDSSLNLKGSAVQSFLLSIWVDVHEPAILSSWMYLKGRLFQFDDLCTILLGTLSLSSPPEASYPSLADLDNGIPILAVGPAVGSPLSCRAPLGPEEETWNGWISGESKLLSGEEPTISAELDMARLVWKALLASNWRAELIDVSKKLLLAIFEGRAVGGFIGRSAGSLTCLFSRLRLLSGFGVIKCPLPPKLLLVSRPRGVSPLTTGRRILDFFRASEAALEMSSAFNWARVHGRIFTAPGFLFLIGSSPFFGPRELTELVSGGTTSNCKYTNEKHWDAEVPRNITRFACIKGKFYLIFQEMSWRCTPSSPSPAEGHERACTA